MTGLMNGAVRIVMLRFSFSDLSLIPACIKEKPAKQKSVGETPGQFVARTSAAKGAECFVPVEKVGCLPFFTGLAFAGYVLVDAFLQVLQKRGADFAVLRFDFAILEQDVSSDEFRQNIRPDAEKALQQMLELSMWRVRAFLNPYFFKEQEVEGQYALSVNLEARTPIFDRQGRPILQWEKDKNGERIGDAPVPVRPKLFLRIEKGDIAIGE